ncbi:hypothetical protein HK098_001403 [Nowakowskiella sp. JEL0407]|nr:hypothetical protein HK098_001403 [Nowakowskiella sp. JEL0407]
MSSLPVHDTLKWSVFGESLFVSSSVQNSGQTVCPPASPTTQERKLYNHNVFNVFGSSLIYSEITRPGEKTISKAQEMLKPMFFQKVRMQTSTLEYSRRSFVEILNSKSLMFNSFKQFCVKEYCHENILCFIGFTEIEELLNNCIPDFHSGCSESSWILHRFVRNHESKQTFNASSNKKNLQQTSLSRRSKYTSPLQQLEVTTELMRDLMNLLEDHQPPTLPRKRSPTVITTHRITLPEPVRERMHEITPRDSLASLPRSKHSSPDPKFVPPHLIPHFLYFYTCFVDEHDTSMTEVNVSQKMKKKVADIMNSREPLRYTIFDEIVDEVLQMLYLDTFKRFVRDYNSGELGKLDFSDKFNYSDSDAWNPSVKSPQLDAIDVDSLESENWSSSMFKITLHIGRETNSSLVSSVQEPAKIAKNRAMLPSPQESSKVVENKASMISLDLRFTGFLVNSAHQEDNSSWSRLMGTSDSSQLQQELSELTLASVLSNDGINDDAEEESDDKALSFPDAKNQTNEALTDDGDSVLDFYDSPTSFEFVAPGKSSSEREGSSQKKSKGWLKKSLKRVLTIKEGRKSAILSPTDQDMKKILILQSSMR